MEHGFDNTAGSDNISGVYQYVDALYEVGVFNYGQRLLLDVIVPNPAALIRDAIRFANGGAVTAYNPPPITFSPSDLTLPTELLGPGNLYPPIAQLNPTTYSKTTTYVVGALVTFNGAPFVSLQGANIGQEPDTSPAWWSSASYAAGTTYGAGAPVIYQGVSYVSLQGANTGNEPDTSPTWWSPNGPLPGSANQTDYTQATQTYQVSGLKGPPDPYITVATRFRCSTIG